MRDLLDENETNFSVPDFLFVIGLIAGMAIMLTLGDIQNERDKEFYRRAPAEKTSAQGTGQGSDAILGGVSGDFSGEDDGNRHSSAGNLR